MESFETEDQQIEAIKQWWRENYKSIVGGILIGLAALFGGRAWFAQQDKHAESASAIYESMMQELNTQQPDKAADMAAQLLGQYSDTPYAILASLAMAKIKVDAKDLVTAKTHLRWAIDHAGKGEMAQIAQLRLARVLLGEGNFDEALTLVTGTEPGNYKAAFEELKGDLYVAKGQIELARSAYNLALATLDQGSRLRQYVQLKLDDLGKSAEPVTGDS